MRWQSEPQRRNHFSTVALRSLVLHLSLCISLLAVLLASGGIYLCGEAAEKRQHSDLKLGLKELQRCERKWPRIAFSHTWAEHLHLNAMLTAKNKHDNSRDYVQKQQSVCVVIPPNSGDE